MWLVDIDALPTLPRPVRWLARFESRDHLGDPAATLRQNVEVFLATHGVDAAGGRVFMLTHARSVGYVFNPLTVFWCYDADGDLACVLAEVHNTYSERHCYLLRPDKCSRAVVGKQFYVSPFYEVAGHYRMSLPPPGERLSLTVTLHPPGGAPFAAQLRGSRQAGTLPGLLRAWVRRPYPARRRHGPLHHRRPRAPGPPPAEPPPLAPGLYVATARARICDERRVMSTGVFGLVEAEALL